MRIPFALAAMVALATPVLAQNLPPQIKDNDASIDGAITTKPPAASPIPERRDDTVNTLGRSAPSAGDTTTGSAPLPGESAVDREIDATGAMDDDASQIDRHRGTRSPRR
jgi:hypothetical protein